VQLVSLVPLLGGLLVAVVGFLGLTESLPRNRFGGVRTSATMRDDEAFRVGNKVAGLPTMVGGLVGVLGGGVAFLMPGTGGLLASVIIGVTGMLAITFAAGVLGHRAAASLPDPKPAPPAGCGGCACGACHSTFPAEAQ
jgi:hypothetical protein